MKEGEGGRKKPEEEEREGRGEGRRGEGGKKRGKRTLMWERNISGFPPTHYPIGDQTCNPQV